MGWTLTAADINSDGFADLVIGAPFAPGAGSQRGMIAVMYASSQLQGRPIHDLLMGRLNYRLTKESVTSFTYPLLSG